MLPALLFLLSAGAAYAQPCPNLCSGNGECHVRVCHCNAGYEGADCSLRTCPSAPAWADPQATMLGVRVRALDLGVTGTDDGHNTAECANAGTCDRRTGLCACRAGFEGEACTRLTCASGCSGHGVCESMGYHAQLRDPGEGTAHAYATPWDAEMVHGCRCDRGYTGHDCAVRHCPTGDDPLTGWAEDPSGRQFNEKQRLACRASGGHFTLTFRGVSTAYINYDDDAETLARKLEALPTLSSGVAVTSAGGTVCSLATPDGAETTIEFSHVFGDVPLLVHDTTGLALGGGAGVVAVEESIKGTKEDEYCSNRGTCDPSDGVCTCAEFYSTSDGYAGVGNRGDCGHNDVPITTCPGEVSCSGHGICHGYPTYRCECAFLWQGADCSERACAKDRSWFNYPSAPHTAHDAKVECSAAGRCDRVSGECVCDPRFDGAACERLACPSGLPLAPGSGSGTPEAKVCSGHGQCLTMSKLAEETTENGDPTPHTYGRIPNEPSTWDHDKVQGCLCDDGWQGHDCALRTCPHGDDPDTPYSFVPVVGGGWVTKTQVNEVQHLTCVATQGYFYLSFRRESTVRIPHTATKAELEAALGGLRNVDGVKLTTADPASDLVCGPGAGRTLAVEFLAPTGDVPTLAYQLDGVDDIVVYDHDSPSGGATPVGTRGTKEYKECSGRGMCDRVAGACVCFDGFGSSNGQGGPGDRADCGYTMYYTGRLNDQQSAAAALGIGAGAV